VRIIFSNNKTGVEKMNNKKQNMKKIGKKNIEQIHKAEVVMALYSIEYK
jgi:hypothetical protein